MNTYAQSDCITSIEIRTNGRQTSFTVANIAAIYDIDGVAYPSSAWRHQNGGWGYGNGINPPVNGSATFVFNYIGPPARANGISAISFNFRTDALSTGVGSVITNYWSGYRHDLGMFAWGNGSNPQQVNATRPALFSCAISVPRKVTHVATVAARPTTGMKVGDETIVDADGSIYVWDGVAWVITSSPGRRVTYGTAAPSGTALVGSIYVITPTGTSAGASFSTWIYTATNGWQPYQTPQTAPSGTRALTAADHGKIILINSGATITVPPISVLAPTAIPYFQCRVILAANQNPLAVIQRAAGNTAAFVSSVGGGGVAYQADPVTIEVTGPPNETIWVNP